MRKRYRIFLRLVAAAALISVLVTSFSSCNRGKAPEQKAAITICNREFTAAEYSYMYFLQFQKFLEDAENFELENGSGSSGYDKSKLPNEQVLIDDNGNESTYAEYVNQLTKTYWTKIVVYYEMALDEGLSLGDEEKEKKAEKIKGFTDAAKASGVEVNEYLKSFYTEGVTIEFIDRLCEMELLAEKYSGEKMNSIAENFEQPYIDKKYNENKKSYDCVDIKLCIMGETVEMTEKKTEAQFRAEREKMEKDSLKYAKELYEAVRDSESFEKYLVDNKFSSESSVREDTENTSLRQSDVAVGYVVGEDGKTKGILLSQWLFSDERRTGDKCMAAMEEEGQKYYMVVLLERAQYKSKLADLRQIFFSLTRRDENGNILALSPTEIVLCGRADRGMHELKRPTSRNPNSPIRSPLALQRLWLFPYQ